MRRRNSLDSLAPTASRCSFSAFIRTKQCCLHRPSRSGKKSLHIRNKITIAVRGEIQRWVSKQLLVGDLLRVPDGRAAMAPLRYNSVHCFIQFSIPLSDWGAVSATATATRPTGTY